MKKFSLLALAIFAALIAFAACAGGAQDEEESGYALYFLSDLDSSGGGDAIAASSERFVPDETMDTEDCVRALMERLLAGPDEASLRSPIPDGTTLRSLSVSGRRAEIDLSAQYARLSGIDLSLADYCITLTLSQLANVNAVRITADGSELPYRKTQVLLAADTLLSSRESGVRPITVQLYFLDGKTGALKGAWQPFCGWRNPAICDKVRTEDAKLGKPINLLKDGLDGWVSMNPKAKFGWKFKDGVLSNELGLKPDGSWAGGGANIMSKRADFFDFNLEYDVRVPAKSNSGVYLRGRFECQVVDSYGKDVDRHNMAAYYGRVTPSVAAEKRPGEWQHVSVTVYKGHITTYLNGVKIIDNAKLEGVTGGAIDADLNKAGPIYLQGDHSDADYKNMILRPAL